MSSEFAGIVIKPRNFFQNWPLFQTLDVPQIQDGYVINMSKMILGMLKDNTPVRTGALRDSETVTFTFKSGGGLDRRYNIRVGPNKSYAMYPEAGVRESVGRFVAAIGKRIHTGTHPGQQPQWYVKRTYEMANSKIPISLNTELAPQIVAAWNRRMSS